MNAFLWLGVGSTVVLVVAVVFDSIDLGLDAIDLGGDWLSLPTLAAFVGAFGFGAGAVYPTLGLLAVVPGLALGALFGWMTYRLVGVIGGESSPAENQAAMLGQLGHIVTAPSATSYGEVMISRVAGPTKVACQADRTIAAGTEVVVVDVTSSTLVTVEPFNLEL